MLIRLIPPTPHPTILYALTFPSVLPLHDISPSATIPAAWSSQLQILTSILQLEPPSSIHMLDRAVGLVARVHEVSMNVPQKEFVVKFVDGRVTTVPMNSGCVRMLLDVVVDVKGCSEPDSQRNSMESCIVSENTAGSTDDVSGSSPTKSPKSSKHKRQRSLLFSLISSLVPKSLSSSSPPPPSSAPPPAPLPPLPITGRVTSPVPQQSCLASERSHPDLLRRRARATLVDVWRRHVISALAPQHLPVAGYVEWTLIAMASKVRAEMESIQVNSSHGFGSSCPRAGGNRHRKIQSEGRHALDFGDRTEEYESEHWQCRAPSPLPGVLNAEEADYVVYPRREQDEWGVRYPHLGSDEVDVFAVEYTGHNDTLLGEHFSVGDKWDDNERITFELSRMGRHGVSDIHSLSLGCDDRYLRSGDFDLDCSKDDGGRFANVAFDMSTCPLVPSDVNDDEESDDSQTSLRTPEDGEDLPVVPPVQRASSFGPVPSMVSRASSSRPRSRNVSAQFSSPPSSPAQAPTPPAFPSRPASPSRNLDYMDVPVQEFVAARLDYLERVCTALELVRSRAREEGWRLVRATLIGTKNGWLDLEAEGSLELKAKRRAWSSGIRIPAPYPPSRSESKVWDGSYSVLRSPMKPPGLAPTLSGACGPIVPTGLSLGIPLCRSPLAMYVWHAHDENSTLSKYGSLSSVHGMETIEGNRPPRASFTESVTKLFPVCEDEGEDVLDSVPASAVGFPQTVPCAVSATESDCDIGQGLTENEEDPFYFCPSRPRTRTTSMYVVSAPSPPSSSPVLPMFRPGASSPSYQVATGTNSDERRLDASALLLQPLSSLSVSPRSLAPRLALTSDVPFAPRSRAVSLPTPKAYPSPNKTRRTSLNHKDEQFEDLSQAYASPPPEGPLIVSAVPAPHEDYPRYAHVHSPMSTSKKSHASILGRTSKGMVFEQAGSEFTVGIEVALGRAEEGRVVW